ncbi:hypothetical protein AAHC03_013148 [Spirometra sp. Aus1]
MDSYNEEACFKWPYVHLTVSSESVSGTLFLLNSDTLGATLQWIADSDSALDTDSHAIHLADLVSVDRRRLLVGQRCAIVRLVLKNGSLYGPFEFVKGGSTDFIHRLSTFVNLQESDTNSSHFIVQPKLPLYQLPTSSSDPYAGFTTAIQQVGRRVLDTFGLLPGSESFPPQHHQAGQGKTSVGRRAQAQANRNMNYKITCDRAQLLQAELSAEEEAGYQVIRRTTTRPFIELPELSLAPRQPPLTSETWQKHLDREGRVTVIHKLQAEIFNGGVEPELRPTVWKYLLGYLKWDFTSEENAKRVDEKREKYHIIKTFWKSMSPKQVKYCRFYRERVSIIEKDTFRTDRQTNYFRDDAAGNLARLYDILVTYTFYNLDFGYFQGMNDLLAIIMTVVETEEDAFWCFVGLMERLEDHLSEGRFGMKDQFSQLFKLVEILMPRFAAYLRSKEATYMNFCFKWLLILFKREFSYDDIKVLWEALWSDVVPKNFHLLVAASIFYGEMDRIMQTCEDVNQLLQYINSLSGKINVKTTLSRAAGFYQQLLDVNDQLPDDVRVTLGFIPPPTENPSGSADDSTLLFSGSYCGGNNPLDASAANSGEETRFLMDSRNSPSLEVGQDAGDVDLENPQSSPHPDFDTMVMHDPFAPGASQPVTFLSTPKRIHPNRGAH